MKMHQILFFAVQFSEFFIQGNGLPPLLAVTFGLVQKYILPTGWCTALSDLHAPCNFTKAYGAWEDFSTIIVQIAHVLGLLWS
jgi:hypothetical protein